MATKIEHALLTILVAIVAYSLYFHKSQFRQLYYSREDEALLGLDSALGNSSSHYQRVAVGVNANVDLIVPALKVFEKLGTKPLSSAKNHAELSSMVEFVECFSYYFQRCGAAERFVSSKELFDKIVEAAVKIHNSQYDVGGNAALMGLKMIYSNPNSTVLLGGPIGKKLNSLLDNRIVIPNELLQDGDEYHLILEYTKGEVWGEHTATCANRFIITHDFANGQMTAMDKFFNSLENFQPTLIVISGLHLLEGQSDDIRSEKLKRLHHHLQQISSSVPVHLELASMTSTAFMVDVAQQIFPLVDSIGLNEQEMAFLSLSLEGPGGQDELLQHPPEIGLMNDILDWALNTFGKNPRYVDVSSRLTRIHFHSLTYHIIATDTNYWRNNMAASAAGSRAASRQACDKEIIDTSEVELRTPEIFARSVKSWELRRNLVKRDEANPVTEWANNRLNFYFSAVLVCKQPKRTVGLGDCISATGLQHSIFMGK